MASADAATVAVRPQHSFQSVRPWHYTGRSRISTLLMDHDLRISFDGSPYHGHAMYNFIDGVGRGAMTFHWNGNEEDMKTVLLDQYNDTSTYPYFAANARGNVIMVQN